MQFKKLLKGLTIILSTIAIEACTSNNHIRDYQSGENIISTDTAMDTDSSSGNVFAKEQTRLQIQQLQRNNIIYFDLDKYDIHSDFTTMLDIHANFLRSNPSYKVTAEGHTDERGTPEYNIALGERRANAVKTYLQSKGVSADQVSIISYGKEKPVALDHDEAAYAKNRRTVLIY